MIKLFLALLFYDLVKYRNKIDNHCNVMTENDLGTVRGWLHSGENSHLGERLYRETSVGPELAQQAHPGLGAGPRLL